VRRREPRYKRRVRGTRFRRLQRRRKEAQAIRATPALPDDPFELDDRYNPIPSKPPGFFAMILGFLFGKKDSARPRPALSAPDDDARAERSDDAVRAILALPRGAARLDAFERTLEEVLAGTPSHKSVAVAFWRELTALAERAEVDLSLLKSRTEACAEALIAADEIERAGQLLAKIGKQRRAAELFVAAGAIEDLEAAHADLSLEEGGRRLDARLAYERFEGLFLVGLRRDALDALDAAIAAWPDNPVYREIGESFRRRLQRGRVGLRVGDRSIAVERFPLTVGRAESSSLRVASPLVSREHAEINLDANETLLRDLQARGDVTLDDEPLAAPRPLDGEGGFALSGVALRYARAPQTLVIWAESQPDVCCVGVVGDEADVPLGDGASLRIRFDDKGLAEVLPGAGVHLADGKLERPALLLEGDRLTVGSQRVRVAG
jgi:tetratricopeptide (TPR) repeat protein